MKHRYQQEAFANELLTFFIVSKKNFTNENLAALKKFLLRAIQQKNFSLNMLKIGIDIRLIYK